jgi:hypothetical protein
VRDPQPLRRRLQRWSSCLLPVTLDQLRRQPHLLPTGPLSRGQPATIGIPPDLRYSALMGS